MTRSRSMPAAALAACLLGFVWCPLPFLALAARAELQPMASTMLFSIFSLSAGVLLVRLLRKPSETPSFGIAIGIVELASWATLAAILLFISKMHLMRGVERWGTVSLVFMSASVLCFPVVWMRRTAVEQRIKRLPRAMIVSALCIVLAVTSTTIFLYVTTPARFL